MLKLFVTGTTRALPPCILMEECAVPYELTVIDIRQAARPEEFLRLQLQGRLPALIDDGIILDQSVAILIHLAEKFDVFLPKHAVCRAEALRMLMVAATDVMFGHAIVYQLIRSNESNGLAALLSYYRQRLLGDIAKCNKALESRPYLAGDISIADIMLYTIVGQYNQENIRRVGFGALSDWIDRIRSRPAVQAAEAKCPYLFDVSETLGQEVYMPSTSSRGA